jgi:hypothetical protein
MLQPQPPEFTFIVHNVILSTYVLPNLPQPIYKLAYPRTAGPLTISSNVTASTASLSASTISGHSSVSSVTVPSVGSVPTSGSSTQADKRRGTFQANLTPDRALKQTLAYGTTIKDSIGTDPPPSLDDGSPICLSFYLRNGCWSNCRRASTHNRTLSPTEKAKLESYVQHQAEKLRRKTIPEAAINP